MKIGVAVSVPPRKFLGFCERVDDYLAGIESGQEVFGFTSGEFSLIDILAACVRRMRSPAVVLSTWTAARAEMDHVHEFLGQGGISGVRWIVDRSFQNRQPELCRALRDKFGDDCIRVQRVHCKFALLDDGERKISVQTSANLNRNIRIENLCISTCPVFFEAYSGLVANMFDAQMPGAGFESSAAVTASFKSVANKRTKKTTVRNPWLEN